MIFGFNTDVKHGDTVYHVQSEARESEKLLQTQVFMRGRCIGKKAISYADWPASAESGTGRGDDPQAGDPGGDSRKEQQLREQHRAVLEAIKEGNLANVLDQAETDSLSAVKHLDVEWENASSVYTSRILTVRLRVTEDGVALPSARLTVRLTRPAVAPFYTQAISDAGGTAEISLEIDGDELPDSSIMVQAIHEGRTVTRKFVLHKTN